MSVRFKSVSSAPKNQSTSNEILKVMKLLKRLTSNKDVSIYIKETKICSRTILYLQCCVNAKYVLKYNFLFIILTYLEITSHEVSYNIYCTYTYCQVRSGSTLNFF